MEATQHDAIKTKIIRRKWGWIFPFACCLLVLFLVGVVLAVKGAAKRDLNGLLWNAVTNGDPVAVRDLLDQGANPNSDFGDNMSWWTRTFRPYRDPYSLMQSARQDLKRHILARDNMQAEMRLPKNRRPSWTQSNVDQLTRRIAEWKQIVTLLEQAGARTEDSSMNEPWYLKEKVRFAAAVLVAIQANILWVISIPSLIIPLFLSFACPLVVASIAGRHRLRFALFTNLLWPSWIVVVVVVNPFKDIASGSDSAVLFQYYLQFVGGMALVFVWQAFAAWLTVRYMERDYGWRDLRRTSTVVHLSRPKKSDEDTIHKD
jgi:hypothetical protein